MKIYTNNKFTGHYPTGTAAVVCANSAQDAAEFLNIELREQGLIGDAEAKDMVRITDAAESVRILCDGNY